jgi:hypothetical protein
VIENDSPPAPITTSRSPGEYLYGPEGLDDDVLDVLWLGGTHLSATSALLRDGHTNDAAQRELQIRLRSLRTGNNQQWTPF